MELDDPNLPPLARAWALAGADHVNTWIDLVEAGMIDDPVDALASTLLNIVEAQARVIAQLSLRIDAIGAPGEAGQ